MSRRHRSPRLYAPLAIYDPRHTVGCFDSTLQRQAFRGEIGVVVIAIEREILDGDFVELEVILGKL
jgi:hypothetical protein